MRHIALAVLVAGLSACGSVVDIYEPSARDIARVSAESRTYELKPSRDMSRDELQATLNRVTGRIRPVAAAMCDEVVAAASFDPFVSASSCRDIRNTWPGIEYSDRINAFVDENNRMTFYSGLMEAAGSDDEIAAVMAHEYAHIIMGHVDKGMTNRAVGTIAGAVGGALLGTALSGVTGNESDVGTFAAAGATIGAVAALEFSPEMEMESDRIAVYIVKRAGYDMEQGRAFFIRMLKMEKELGPARAGQLLGFVRTHPTDEERIAHWGETMKKAAFQDAPDFVVESSPEERGEGGFLGGLWDIVGDD